MKKLLAILLVMCMVALMCPITVSAATVVASGNCGAQGNNVKWSLDSEGTLTISGKGAMKDYYFPENAPWRDGGTLKKVIIQNGITEISFSAFFGCTNLTDITIPSSVTFINDAAFEVCNSLTSIQIPSSVTRLGDNAFAHSGLKSITIPSSIKKLPNNLFAYSNLTSITIPKSVTSIGEGVFQECDNLVSVTIPDGVSSIGSNTFAGCTNLTSILIPASVTHISGGLHNDFDIGWEAIGWEAAFDNCTNLKDVYYTGTESQWKQLDIEGRTTYNKCLTSATIHYNSSSIPATPKPTVGGFSDVYEGDYYADPVVWAVKNGITDGIGNGMFGPGQNCTRGQIVTFLWRAAGKPEPHTTQNPFADVQESDFFYKPVLWAVENNITTGTGTNKAGQALFSPKATCTRAQAVTFQWRAAGKPTPGTSSKFTDVPSKSYYTDAVSWALENKITDGIGNGKFGPNNTCTRGQIVTFLYRGRTDS